MTSVSLDDNFSNAHLTKIDSLTFNIIDIRDLLANKENLERTGTKYYVDQQDIIALRQILKAKEKEG